jgi:hypothetical protein
MAWQGNGMGMAWTQDGMCELAFNALPTMKCFFSCLKTFSFTANEKLL